MTGFSPCFSTIAAFSKSGVMSSVHLPFRSDHGVPLTVTLMAETFTKSSLGSYEIVFPWKMKWPFSRMFPSMVIEISPFSSVAVVMDGVLAGSLSPEAPGRAVLRCWACRCMLSISRSARAMR